jgi:Flp pilus assembly protein TadD
MASKVMNSQEALQHANSLFVDENFSEALSYYNLSVELDEKNTEALLKRSACYHKLGKLTGKLNINFPF